MKNYKRAKEWINSLEDEWSRVDIDWEAVDEIRELLDKATPQKPNEKKCPNCGESHWMQRYCAMCGQKLDWSEIYKWKSREE